MEEFFAADTPSELFQVEARLAEEDAAVLEEATKTRSTSEITTLFRTKSYVSIGEPVVLSLDRLLKKRGETVPESIQLQMKQYEFYQVQLACSFQPARGCRFYDARFALALQTVLNTPNAGFQTISGNAIAYDLFPQRVEDEYKVSKKYSFSPEIKFSFDPVPVSPGLALPIYEHSEEYIVYKGRIETFDLQGTQPAWSFARTSSHEISGTQKLFMVVRKPKGTQVKAVFNLSAQVQFMIGNMPLDPLPFVMFFRRGSNKPVITDAPTAPLC